MHSHEILITRFYTAFQQRDAAGMIACYHPDVTFSDAVFVNLKGQQANAMWQMLCERGTDLQITFSDVKADDIEGHAHWEARYTFTRSGRRVHNIVKVTFGFQDGKIIQHRDDFSFWRWSAQAFGITGLLLGWTPFLQTKVQQQSRQLLENYMSKQQSG